MKRSMISFLLQHYGAIAEAIKKTDRSRNNVYLKTPDRAGQPGRRPGLKTTVIATNAKPIRMKYILNFLLVMGGLAVLDGCHKYGNYFGGEPSDIVSILDVRPLYKGKDVVLTKTALYGGSKLAAVVISDHSGNNLPSGLLVVQDNRRLSTLRGISIDLGTAAANYHPGDSVMIDIEGSTLTRKNGILTIDGITGAKITAMGQGTVNVNAVTAAQLETAPDNYESTLCVVNKAGFSPAPVDGDVISGDKIINDGYADLTLYTDPGASYAKTTPYGLAAYVGIPFETTDSSVQFRTRLASDMVNLGSSLQQDLIITGIQSDPKGGDGGYEYVQMMATKDIDFSVTPYSIVVCNNAGTSASATPLSDGWATGGMRTIKWNIRSGKVAKGQFFYWGEQGKKINGSAGTYPFPDTSDYYMVTYNSASGSTNAGDANSMVHTPTFSNSGPWANSGNTCGVALFRDTVINEKSVPEDVLFIATGGGVSVYNNAVAPILGYRICNNDWYSMYSVSIDPQTYLPVATPYLYYRSNGNTASMPYPVNAAHPTAATDAGLFSMMGGVYNITLGRWTTARSQHVVELFQASASIDTLEKSAEVTQLVE